MSETVIRKLLDRREKYLAPRSTRSIAALLGRLSARWLKRDFSYRRKAARRLEVSGFTRKMSDAMLDALFAELSEKKLLRLVRSELGSVDALDRFVRRSGRLCRLLGPKLTTHVFASNVPAPAVQSVVLGLLLKSANACKPSSRDAGFLDIYLDSLGGVDRGLASVNALIGSSLDPWLASSDAVIVYGRDETLHEIRGKAPAKAVFIGYGSRFSFSWIAKSELTAGRLDFLAGRVAWDVWMADQRGCLSPLVLYAQKGGSVSPVRLAEKIALALEKISKDDKISFGKASAHHALRDAMRIGRLTERKSALWEGRPKGRWAVTYGEDVFRIPSVTGNRILHVRAFGRAGEVFRALAPHSGRLQAAAVEAVAAERLGIGERLASLGVTRVCRAGRLQAPPALWHHDGRPNLAPLVSWTDLEN